jgi:hypothetical protein
MPSSFSGPIWHIRPAANPEEVSYLGLEANPLFGEHGKFGDAGDVRDALQEMVVRPFVNADGHDGVLALARSAHGHETDVDRPGAQERRHSCNDTRSIHLSH